MDQDRRQQMRAVVEGLLRLFKRLQRDCSAEAIAVFLDLPELYSVDLVRELLTEIRQP